jgi:hypothetical protein
MRTRLLAAALAGVLSSSALACTPIYDRWTEIRVRDPARVALRSAGGREEILPEGAEAASAPAGRGTFPTGESTSADYAVRAVRAQGGALAYEVDSRLPLATGERLQIVHPDGKLVTMAPELVPSVEDGPTYLLPMCGRLVQVHGRYGTRVEATHGERCSPATMYGGTLATPRDNLLSIRRIERGGTSRVVGWVLFGSFVVPIAGAGALLTALGSSAGEGGEKWAGIGLLAAAGLAFAALVPWLGASDRDVELYPRAPATADE